MIMVVEFRPPPFSMFTAEFTDASRYWSSVLRLIMSSMISIMFGRVAGMASRIRCQAASSGLRDEIRRHEIQLHRR